MIAALGALGACSSATTGSGDSVELTEFVAPSQPRDRDAVLAEIASAQQLWESKGPADYSLGYMTRCGNCLVDGSTSSLEVEGGIITSDQNRSPVYGGLPSLVDSVDMVLIAIADAAEVGLVLDAEFDGELGYPTYVVISSEFADRQTDTDVTPFGIRYTLTPS